MSNQKLILPLRDTQTLFNSIKSISVPTILDVKKDEMNTIVSNADRSIYLWANMKGDFGVDVTLNLPSVSKLSELMSIVGTNEIPFNLKKNKLEYRGSNVRFDYHLHDDGILTKSKIKKEKIEQMDFKHSFEVDKKFFDSLLKTSNLFKDSNKIYISTDGNDLVWSLDDKNRMNIDKYSIVYGEVDFSMSEPFIMCVDNCRLIDFMGNEKIKFELTENFNACKITVCKESTTLRYVFSSYIDN